MRSRDPELNQQRKAMILKAAAACFVKQGFHAASMKDVCAAAGMSPGTVYHYVRSKTDIIRGIIEQEQAITADLLRPLVDAEDFVAAFHAALDAIAASITQDDLILSAEISAETLRQPDLQALAAAATSEAAHGLGLAIERGQACGQIDVSLVPEQTANTLIALIDGLLWQATLFGAEQMVQQLTSAKQAVSRMLDVPERSR
jgi:TetR/AcrR family transcriptional regulator, repressor for uid operon